MNAYGKVAIVIALAAVVAAVLYARQNRSSPASEPRPAPPEVADIENLPPGDTAATEPAPRTTEASDSDAPRDAPEQEKSLPRLVDLGAGKCIPCKMMAPILEDLRKEFQGQMEVEFIDVWKNRDAGKEYDVRIIPTQIFYDASGAERFRHEGFYSRDEILAKCKELGYDLNSDPEAK